MLGNKGAHVHNKSMLCHDINVLVSHYFNSGRSVLDTLAPVVKTLLPVRERRPWFNNNLRENKKIRKSSVNWKESGGHHVPILILKPSKELKLILIH